MLNTGHLHSAMTVNSHLTAVVWGLFLKLEEFKLILNKITVPSLPVCGTIFTSTILIYNKFFPSKTVLTAGIIFLMLTIVFIILCINRYLHFFNRKNNLYYIRITCLVVIFVSIPPIIYTNINYLCKYKNQPSVIVNFSAIVKNIAEKKNTTELTAEVSDSNEYPEIKIILYYNGRISLNKGDEIFIHKPIKFKQYKDTEENYNSFKLKGINYISSITDNDITAIREAEPGHREILKKKLIKKIDSLFQKDTANIIKAFFLGNRSSVSKDVTIQFRDAGALHLLAASGLHVGIAAGLPLFLLLLNFRKKTLLFLSLLSVFLYLYITDMPISLVRASLMFFLFAAQVFIHRKPAPFNTLMLTGSIIVLIAPWEIFNIGFQLSFSATLGIILFYKVYKKSFIKLPSYIRNSLAVSLSAQIFTLPLILIHLNQINTISLFSNIVLIPVTSIFMYTAFSTLLLSAIIPSSGFILSEITRHVYHALIASAGFFAGFDCNFFLNNITPVILLLSLSLIPVLPIKLTRKLRAAPVYTAFILCTFLLKGHAEIRAEEIIFSSGNSNIILHKKEMTELILDIKDLNDIDLLINEFKKTGTKVNVLIINNGSFPNQIACKKICSEFIIDECSFYVLPDISSNLKNLISSLETDNIKISFHVD